MTTCPTDDRLADKCRRALAGREGYVPLEPGEERELGRRSRAGDREAAWTLVLANESFVRTVARRYQRDGIDFEDLVAEGLTGLLDATSRFDPDRGIKFITYGIWWIKRSILRHLRAFEHPVHVPKYKQLELQEFWKTHRRLSGELGRSPSLEELAEATGAGPRDIKEFFALAASRDSLDDDASRAALGLRAPGSDAEQRAVDEDGRRRAVSALAALTPRERLIIEQRFGLGGVETKTLAGIGREIGLTKERVRQLEARACRKLHEAMHAPPPDRPVSTAA